MNNRKPRSVGKNKKAGIGGFDIVRQKANLLVIWVLVVINAVLIFSFVQKLTTTSNVPSASVSRELEGNLPALKVQVLNGCGIRGVAQEFADMLDMKDYDIIDVANADKFDHDKTMILDRGTADSKLIKKLVSDLGNPTVLAMQTEQSDYDVTIYIGGDFKELKLYKDFH